MKKSNRTVRKMRKRLDGIYYGVPGGGAYDERFGVLCAAGEPARCDQRRPDAAQRRAGGHCAGSGRRQKLCVLLAGGKLRRKLCKCCGRPMSRK